MAGSICATSLVMLACSLLRLAGRGLYSVPEHLELEVLPEAEVKGGEVGGARRPLHFPQAPPAYHYVAKLVVTTVFLVLYECVIGFSTSTAIFAKTNFS